MRIVAKYIQTLQDLSEFFLSHTLFFLYHHLKDLLVGNRSKSEYDRLGSRDINLFLKKYYLLRVRKTMKSTVDKLRASSSYEEKYSYGKWMTLRGINEENLYLYFITSLSLSNEEKYFYSTIRSDLNYEDYQLTFDMSYLTILHALFQ